MGFATNVLLFSLLVSGFFQLVDPVNFKTPYASLVESLTGRTLVYDAQGNAMFTANSYCANIPLIGNRCFDTGSMALPALFLILVGLATGAALLSIIPGTAAFPNPFLLFSGIFLLLVGFFTFPISLLTTSTAPNELRVIFIPFFMGSYLLYIIMGFRGGPAP